VIRVGVSPVGWSNDDLPTLGAEIGFERCLDEASRAGFEGIEMGHKFPRDPVALHRALDDRGLRLVSAWHGTRLLERPLADELRQVEPLLDLLEGVDADRLVVAEITGSVHRERFVPLGRRPILHPEVLKPFGEAMTALADAALERGIQLAYHHHMGTVIETREDVDALVAHTGDAVGLTIDTGHAGFARMDPTELLRSHRSRLRHVHLKDVRAEVFERTQREPSSFLDAIVEGVFTVPGDGDLHFATFVAELRRSGYDGWLVVEADQDPQRADPLIYARMGRESVRKLLR